MAKSAAGRFISRKKKINFTLPNSKSKITINPDPIMKNTITLDQFRALDKLVDKYNDEHAPTLEDLPVMVMLTTEEGEGPEPEETAVMCTIEAHDWDGHTDYDTLFSLLNEAGVNVDTGYMLSPYEVDKLMRREEWKPTAYYTDGDATWGSNHSCRTYAYCLPIIRN